jgi:hypothetical protein
MVADFLVGLPDFMVTIDGQAVLGPTERPHMVDVRERRAAVRIAPPVGTPRARDAMIRLREPATDMG